MIRALCELVRDERSGRGREASLARGTRGAMLVIGVFMAMFLVGVLYYSIGVGEAILFRERLQDAADAASFSAAVMDARGMNLIALVNIVMASALAVLVALFAIKLLAWGAIMLASGPHADPAWRGAVPTLRGVANAVSALYVAKSAEVDQVLLAGHRAGAALRDGMPFVAQNRAAAIVAATYSPPAQVGFIWPAVGSLPTEDSPLPVLCSVAAVYAGLVVMTRFDELTLPDGIQNYLSSQADAMDSQAASIVCGGSLVTPTFSDPRIGLVAQPETPAERDCRTGSGSDPTAACATAAQQVASDQYNPDNGQCDGMPTGSSAAACAANVDQANAACDPSNPGLTQFVYRVSEQRWTVSCPAGAPDCSPANLSVPIPTHPTLDPDVTPNPHVVIRQVTPLCGAGGSISTSYGATGMVCRPSTTQIANSPGAALLATLGPGHTVDVPVSVVEAVLGCAKYQPLVVPGVPGIPTTGSARSSQQVLDGVHLGDDAFQLRGFVVGARDFDRDDRGVRVANGGRDDASAVRTQLAQLRDLGHLAMAQAEFYYTEGSDTPDQWLWNMRWSARLRRVRMPTASTGATSLQAACAAGAGGAAPCAGVDGLLAVPIDSLVVH